jgi:endonuclease/exonuclease/phosphatase family metal-dependent hydrolase
LSAAVLACWLAAATAHAQSLEVMTYNIRYDNAEDGTNAWEFRKAGVASLLTFYAPDVIGIQEAEYHQVRYLDDAMPHYRYVGVGRDDGRTGGEFAAIFYDSRRLRVLDSSTFWLSGTPDVASLGWDAALKRVCTYARFQDLATSREFWVFNTHFDHEGAVARANSATLVRDQIDSLNADDDPVLLMGDFNALPDSQPISILRASFDDTKQEASQVRFGPDATFGGFRVDSPLTRRIDYIFTSPGDWGVLKYAVLNHSRDGSYYSDHLPVFVEVVMRSP